VIERLLKHLPAPLHRAVLRMAHPLRLWWWRRTAHAVRGCTIIAANAAGHILLVRHSYHLRGVWTFPGGGLGPGESPLDTAVRELAEETTCLLSAPRHLGTITRDRGGWTNLIELVAGHTHDAPVADGREIVEARFFDPQELPVSTARHVAVMIAQWQENQNGSSA